LIDPFVPYLREPTVTRIIWLFSLVLDFSRLIWTRFVLHQDVQAVLRCHMAAFEAIGDAPHEICYDRMKTAVIGEVAAGSSTIARSSILPGTMASSRRRAPLQRS